MNPVVSFQMTNILAVSFDLVRHMHMVHVKAVHTGMLHPGPIICWFLWDKNAMFIYSW